MFAVENYIMRCTQSQATIFAYLREMILSCSALIEEKVQESKPQYYYHGLLCSIENSGNCLSITFNNSNPLTGKIPGDKTLLFESVKEVNVEAIFAQIEEVMFQNKLTSPHLVHILD